VRRRFPVFGHQFRKPSPATIPARRDDDNVVVSLRETRFVRSERKEPPRQSRLRRAVAPPPCRPDCAGGPRFLLFGCLCREPCT
jgi:hypothetical protein